MAIRGNYNRPIGGEGVLEVWDCNTTFRRRRSLLDQTIQGAFSSDLYSGLLQAKTLKNHNIKYLKIVLQWFYSVIFETTIGIARFYFFQQFFNRFVIIMSPTDISISPNLGAKIISKYIKTILSCGILTPESKMHLIFKID